MQITGTVSLAAAPAAVWAGLHDPGVLRAAIPGCQRLEVTGPQTYACTVAAAVAAVSGSYAGTLTCEDRQPPHLLVWDTAVGGPPGSLHAQVSVRLRPAGPAGTATDVDYTTDATVDGLVGGVGQRVLAATAARSAVAFFTALERLVSAPAPDPATPAGATGPRPATGPTSPASPARPAGRGPGGRAGRGVALGVLGTGVAGLLGWLVRRRARSGRS
jgi:carbon monoxide dehydrogenase subunit G